MAIAMAELTTVVTAAATVVVTRSRSHSDIYSGGQSDDCKDGRSHNEVSSNGRIKGHSNGICDG